MYAVQFQAPIYDGVVHIPKQYKQIQHISKARFVVMYDRVDEPVKNDKEIQAQLDLFHSLIGNANNKIMATYELATNTDGMIEDAIL